MAKGNGSRKPAVRFNFEQWHEFVRVWQRVATLEDACAQLKLDVKVAQSKASALRKLGVELRRWGKSSRLSKAEVDKLKAIARSEMVARIERETIVRSKDVPLASR